MGPPNAQPPDGLMWLCVLGCTLRGAILQRRLTAADHVSLARRKRRPLACAGNAVCSCSVSRICHALAEHKSSPGRRRRFRPRAQYVCAGLIAHYASRAQYLASARPGVVGRALIGPHRFQLSGPICVLGCTSGTCTHLHYVAVVVL